MQNAHYSTTPIEYDNFGHKMTNRISDILAKLTGVSGISDEDVEVLGVLIAKLEDSRANLKRLHQISTKSYDSLDDMLDTYLETGCELLQLEMGVVSNISLNDGKYIINNVYPGNRNIDPGDVYDLVDTYCAAVAESGTTVTYSEVGAIETMRQHPIYQNMGLEAYIGTPIYIDDDLFGTLNFTSSFARHNQFGDLEVEFVEIMAQQIASAIQNEFVAQHNREITVDLAYNEEKLRMFVKHTPAAVAMFDRDMRYLLCSDRWKVDYEVVGKNLIGVSHYEIFPDIGDEWKEIHQRCLQGHIQRREEDLFLRDDGRRVWIKWEVRPWYQYGEIGGIIMFTEVITQRKEAELAFQQQQLLYQALVAHLPNMSTIMFDTDKRFLIVDGPFLNSLGYDASSVIGHKLEDSVSPGVLERMEPLYDRVLSGEMFQTEQRSANNVYYDARFVPIFDDLGNVTHGLITVQDITVEKEAELALKSLNDKLVRMNEEVQQFAYIVSHDMRAPLVNLKGFSNILLESSQTIEEVLKDIDIPDEQQSQELEQILTDRIPAAVQFIFSSVERMDTFSQAILELSRIERRELHCKDVNTDSIVERILSSLAHELLSKSIQITMGKLPPIYGDEVSIDQIFGNIISNAVKYMPADRQGKIKISAQANEDKVTFSIADNGVGIQERDYEKVFAPFRRIGRSKTEGHGMGLAYVQAQVRRHGGDIWFESEVDKGTTFYFTLPTLPALH